MPAKKSGQQYTVVHNMVGHYRQGETFGANELVNQYGAPIEDREGAIQRLLDLGAIVKGEDLPEDVVPGTTAVTPEAPQA